MRPPERFETARLLLRPPNLDDAKPIFDTYAHDPEVTRYLVWEPHETLEDTQIFLHRCLDVWKEETAFPWALVIKETDQLIGMLELRFDGHKADLGYVMARSFWGEGFATEAAKLVVDWALAQPPVHRVWAVCDVDNYASARVLEKAGMQREGILRRWIRHPSTSKKPRDCYVYAVVK